VAPPAQTQRGGWAGRPCSWVLRLSSSSSGSGVSAHFAAAKLKGVHRGAGGGHRRDDEAWRTVGSGRTRPSGNLQANYEARFTLAPVAT